MEQVDFAICGGRIVDPATGLDGRGSVGVRNGKIAVIDMDSSVTFDPQHVVSADGYIVIPGMIDCHVHAYQHATPLGINIDESCLARGVTTAVDAGSAGASTFPGLRKFIAERSDTRLLAFLHIASHGLASAGCSAGASGGECDHLNQVDVTKCVQCVTQNTDMIVGVKVRVSQSCTDNGRTEEEVYRRALAASTESGVPLMVHHTMSTVPVAKQEGKLCCPSDMKPGDIYTHAFMPHLSHILDQDKKAVHPDVWEAKKRGIYFDIGHGAGSFGWTVAEICTKEGFWPDIISTDLHCESVDGPAYDLATVMTKMYALGMPLNDVIASVTSQPAAAIKRSNCLGSLQVGREADISMLKIEECDIDLEDCYGQIRKVKKRFIPVGVWRNGKRFDVSPHPNYPNIDSIKHGINAWDSTDVRDATKPSLS
ncbi:deacetylase Atu3266-like isoform X1 [Haliotis rufescens]|uniref:deacetylase Atu3266-like isoform X1 n=1 Tax=Haliotis rufescens TaxID=6454 RepID=UPI00201EFED8|nr:deacetylase Atu3266-like isoform X1 [Haliotis rufescens]